MKSYKIEIKTGEEVDTVDLGLLDDRLTAIVACDTLYYERCRLIGDYACVYEDGASYYVHCIEKWGVASIEAMKTRNKIESHDKGRTI